MQRNRASYAYLTITAPIRQLLFILLVFCYPQTPGTTTVFLASILLYSSYVLVLWHWIVCAWFISFSIMTPKPIRVVANVKISSMLWLHVISLSLCATFIYPSVDAQIGCFHFLAIVNTDAVSVGVQSLIDFVFLGYAPSHGTAGPQKL